MTGAMWDATVAVPATPGGDPVPRRHRAPQRAPVDPAAPARRPGTEAGHVSGSNHLATPLDRFRYVNDISIVRSCQRADRALTSGAAVRNTGAGDGLGGAMTPDRPRTPSPRIDAAAARRAAQLRYEMSKAPAGSKQRRFLRRAAERAAARARQA
jgi:hypothetical protein